MARYVNMKWMKTDPIKEEEESKRWYSSQDELLDPVMQSDIVSMLGRTRFFGGYSANTVYGFASIQE